MWHNSFILKKTLFNYHDMLQTNAIVLKKNLKVSSCNLNHLLLINSILFKASVAPLIKPKLLFMFQSIVIFAPILMLVVVGKFSSDDSECKE